MPPLILMLIAATLAISGISQAQFAPDAPVHSETDPAVIAYTTLVKHVELNSPVDRTKVIAFVDLLVGTLEGFALGRGVRDESLMSRIHHERRELRQFANNPNSTPNREQQGHQIFAGIVQLFRDIDKILGTDPQTSVAIEALDRSAKSLETETVLRWQPHNIQQFLRLGGEILTKMAARPFSKRQ